MAVWVRMRGVADARGRGLPALAGVLCALALSVAPAASGAQNSREPSALVGMVVSSSTGNPLPYSNITLLPAGRQIFGEEDGSFTLRRVPPGRYQLRVRQLGYAAGDTVIVVPAQGELPPITIALRRLAITLAATSIVATGECTVTGVPDSAAVPELAAVFGEVRKNGERIRLLAERYPFEYRMRRTRLTRVVGDRVRSPRTDTVLYRSDVGWGYRPGHVVSAPENDRREERSEQPLIFLPTVATFTDSAFAANHCFRYAGIDTTQGGAYARLDFEPAVRVREPDLSGSIYLDTATYMVRRTVFRLTAPEGVDPDLRRVEVTTTFGEFAPSLVMLTSVRAVNTRKGRWWRDAVGTIEEGKLLDYSFLRASPLEGAPPRE